MANTKSAKKADRKNQKRNAISRARKSMVETLIKKVSLLLQKGESTEGEALFRKTQAAIQRATRKGVLHQNKGARKISALAKKLKTKKEESTTTKGRETNS